MQSDLITPLLSGDSLVARKALRAIEHFRLHGIPPQEVQKLIDAGVVQDHGNAMVAFFKRMAFNTYRAALSQQQARLLAATCIFANALGIPRPAVEAAGSAADVVDGVSALDRLMGLGLVDDYGIVNGTSYVAVNPLARPLVQPFDATTVALLATASVPAFARSLCDTQADDFPADARAAGVDTAGTHRHCGPCRNVEWGSGGCRAICLSYSAQREACFGGTIAACIITTGFDGGAGSEWICASPVRLRRSSRFDGSEATGTDTDGRRE